MKIFISSLFYWPQQIFLPGDGNDTRTSIIVVSVGFVSSGVAVVCGPTVAIVGFIVAWLATVWARHEIDRGDAYAFDRARRANVAYIIGGMGWMFRATTVVLAISVIGWHYFK